MFEKISVIGLGYIGLPTAAMFASRKRQVLGVDINQAAVDTVNKGEIHIVEPDLDVVVNASVTEGFLRASVSPDEADAFLVAVPTPFNESFEPDLSYIHDAAKAIAPVLRKGNIVVLESTAPVGTTSQLSRWLSEYRTDLKFPLKSGDLPDVHIAHCPERVLPGHVMRELVENDRVIGGITAKCAELAEALYKIFVEGDCIKTDCATAEMAKLTENAYRDVNIAFANELSVICEELNINVWELISLANRHPRVNILQPGPGVGGHCIAVDPWFIVSKTPSLAKLIKTARVVNDSKPDWVLDKVRALLIEVAYDKKCAPRDLCVAVFGLSFKPDIDDLRESPALKIALELANEKQCNLLVVEPNINSLPHQLSETETVFESDTVSAIAKADIVLLLVDHKEFKEIPNSLLSQKRLIDTKGIWQT